MVCLNYFELNDLICIFSGPVFVSRALVRYFSYNFVLMYFSEHLIDRKYSIGVFEPQTISYYLFIVLALATWG